MKKAEMTVQMIMGIILLLVSTLAVIVIIIQTSQKIVTTYDTGICRASVVANVASGNLFGGGKWPVKCPTRYHEFDIKGYYEESGESNSEIKPMEYDKMVYFNNCLIKYGDLDDKEKYCRLKTINNLIAKRHLDCWEQFGSGEIPMFDRFESDRQCVVCSVYDFSEDLKKELQYNYQSALEDEGYPEDTMFDYIMNTESPETARDNKGGKPLSYADQVKDPLDIYNPPFYDYFVGESYASVFIANHESFVMSVIGTATENAKKYIDMLPFVEIEKDGEKQYYLNTIEFLPESEVVKECDLLVQQ